uniref:Putative lpxtg-motif cell wall anchor domain protein n=1 Tax=Amblyomma sculptum TaxID=1581419 RepID=A0A1E1XP69_AMBSC
MKCHYNKTTGTAFICNTSKTESVGSTQLNGVAFEICKRRPCNETCVGDERRHCVNEACICKPQYKFSIEEDKCVGICESKTPVCHREATCEQGKDYHSFYCNCPPKLTGPLCQRENKPLQSAKLNIVIVGVVLSSLLLLCFVVSASIISRLKKKAQGPSFNKDAERRPPRELRGYEGPYRASDPASLQRERDYTSL